jgi:hypothetical protein
MSRDMTVAWELLTAVERARQQIAKARPQIWERFRLPTAEHTSIGLASADGERVVLRVSLETHLADGRLAHSCLDVAVGSSRWRVQTYILLTGGATSTFLWQGQSEERDDTTGFLAMVESVTQGLIQATLSMDFAAITAGSGR